MASRRSSSGTKGAGEKVAVTGGAGFIGSNLVDRLIAGGHDVTVFDNLSGGREDFLARHAGNPRFRFVRLDVRDFDRLAAELPEGLDCVYHLAANADIARGVEDPTLDFEHSIVATFSVLRAMRHRGVRKIVYTSGSGVYGDRGKQFSAETFGPLEPVSMYGASKLGAEGLISAFAHLFEMQAWIVRPANIIGPRLTHGVVFDFVRRLRSDPTQLRILGDGKQSKAYLHVDDVLDAIFLVQNKTRERFNVFNLSSSSFVSVNQIADSVARAMKLKNVRREYTGGKIGWKGDVAVVRLNNTRLKKLGWKPRYDSASAVKATIASLLDDPRIAH